MQRRLWPNNYDCAVSLTYADAIPSHISDVAPLLEANGIRATFYVDMRQDFFAHADAWGRIAAAGHELGNHSAFHPCRMDEPWDWLDECFNLCDYTPARLRGELALANRVLKFVDGRSDKTYGNTCGNTTIGRGASEQSMSGVLSELFIGARGATTNRIAQPLGDFDPMNVGAISSSSLRTLEDYVDLIGQCRSQQGWAVVSFHGIGIGTHATATDAILHEQFIQCLERQRASVWTAPFRDVISHLRQNKS